VRWLQAFRQAGLAKRQAWEAVCRRCGLCCYDRDPDARGVLIVHLTSPCRHLDLVSRLCTIYENRLKKCRECRKVTLLHALFSRYLPDSCGYALRYGRWRGFFLRMGRQLPLG
jgi:uncharacterized cysteine cluster protein YcgN (CxxCxxCC family)